MSNQDPERMQGPLNEALDRFHNAVVELFVALLEPLDNARVALMQWLPRAGEWVADAMQRLFRR